MISQREPNLKDAVEVASQRPEVVGAVEEIYRAVQSEIDARRPVCVMSGRCCRFEEYGHRMYVTTLELAAFLRQLGTVSIAPSSDGFGCPFQAGKLCGVHAIRPFGCRIFFCDPTAGQWQNDAYERFHAELKRLHEEMHVPYYYVEWRQALAALGIAGTRAATAMSGT